jgi:dihydrofolate reductase
MPKIIAAINLTLDGFCDHTAGIPDAELHQHYADLLRTGSAILYGRTTYQLMQYWQPLAKNPSGEKAADDFAQAIDQIPKIVFSNTLQQTNWASAALADKPLAEAVKELRQQPGKPVFVGSPGLIIQLMNQNLIDEYQLCFHPVVSGGSQPLFEHITGRTVLKLAHTKTFGSGAIILYYQPASLNPPTDGIGAR